MADTIGTRVARIITGGAHALLEKAENIAPAVIMSQAVREIDQVATEIRGDIGKCEAAKHLILSQIAKLDREYETLTEQVDFALGQSRDDLASAAIGRQTDIEDLLPVLQRSLDEHSERGNELESYIVALLAKKRELEQLLADHLAAQRHQNAAPTMRNERQSRIHNATASFSRVLEQQTGLGFITGSPGQDAEKLKELNDLQRQRRIAERLNKVKISRANH